MKDLLFRWKTSSSAQEWRLVLGLLTLLAVPVSFSYFFGTDLQIDVPVENDSISSLESVFRKNGLESFKTAKKSLRQRVSVQIKDAKNEKNRLAAMNVAIYLFPDLLPESRLDKQEAEDLFVPLQRAIEEMPGTPEAQARFEELRSNVWNFESPNSSTPVLSEQANQMLKIYGAMSWK